MELSSERISNDAYNSAKEAVLMLILAKAKEPSHGDRIEYNHGYSEAIVDAYMAINHLMKDMG